MNRCLSIFVALIAGCLPALAQSGSNIRQSGNVTPSHVGAWTTNGILQDGGTAAIPFLTSIGAVNPGPSICAWSALSTSGAAQQLCLGATNAGGATITVQNFGSASALPLSLSLNGIIYQFPFSSGGIIGPVTTIINDGACWANTVGTLLKECAPLVLLNGTANGEAFKNSLGTPDAKIMESAGNNLIVQMSSSSNTLLITDGVGNQIATFQSPQTTVNGAVQSQMLSGNCGVGDEDLTVSGTPTATEQPGFSFKVGATTVNVTYTVQPGDTNNNIAQGLAAAALANAPFLALLNGACPNGTIYNGAVTPVFLGAAQMGFDAVYTSDPNLSGNAFTGINSVHTTITTFPVSTLAGALYHADNVFIAGRHANVGDVPYQNQLFFQDNTGTAGAYFTETYTVLGATPGALRVDKNWLMGPCGYDFITNTGIATFDASGCDLSLIANSATTNNVNISPGSAGAINLQHGSGGVVAGINGGLNGKYCTASATSGTICLVPPNGALGSAVLTLPDVTDTLTANAATQTLLNKTITSSTDTLGGVTMGMGSDATGDIYYRNSGGVLTRLPIGSSTQQLTVSGGLPAWAPNTGAMANLATLTASSSATLGDTTHITGTYTSYLVVFQNIVPATDSKILELQIHSGGAFKNSGYIYSYYTANSAQISATNSASASFIPLSWPADSISQSLHNTAPGLNGTITITNPSVSGLISVSGQINYLGAGGAGFLSVGQTVGYWGTAGVVDGFQVLMDSGNITSGSIIIYGIL